MSAGTGTPSANTALLPHADRDHAISDFAERSGGCHRLKLALDKVSRRSPGFRWKMAQEISNRTGFRMADRIFGRGHLAHGLANLHACNRKAGRWQHVIHVLL